MLLLMPSQGLDLSKEIIPSLAKIYRCLTNARDVGVLKPVQGSSPKESYRGQYVRLTKPMSVKKLCCRTKRVTMIPDFVLYMSPLS